jgi:indole-3-acetate monooxygenase
MMDLSAPTLQTYLAKTLPADWIHKAHEEKWFKLFLPESLGGPGFSFHTALLHLFEGGNWHGSLGWAMNLGAGGGYFYPFLDATAAEELYSPANAVLAGSGQSNASALPTENGYILNGSWEKCTGAEHATFFTGNASLPDGTIRTFIFRPEQVNLNLNGWKGVGLIPSSSLPYSVNQEFVPEKYSFALGEFKHHRNFWIEKLDFETFGRFCMAATFWGLIGCFLRHGDWSNRSTEEAKNLEFFIENQCLNQLPLLIQEAENSRLSTRNTLWNKLGHLNMQAYTMACLTYAGGGMHLGNETSIAHWAFRDVLTAVHHYMLHPVKS